MVGSDDTSKEGVGESYINVSISIYGFVWPRKMSSVAPPVQAYLILMIISLRGSTGVSINNSIETEINNVYNIKNIEQNRETYRVSHRRGIYMKTYLQGDFENLAIFK